MIFNVCKIEVPPAKHNAALAGVKGAIGPGGLAHIEAMQSEIFHPAAFSPLH